MCKDVIECKQKGAANVYPKTFEWQQMMRKGLQGCEAWQKVEECAECLG